MDPICCFLLGFATFGCCCGSFEDPDKKGSQYQIDRKRSRWQRSTGADEGDAQRQQLSRDLDAKKTENDELKQSIEIVKQECELLRRQRNDLELENAALRQGVTASDESVRPPAYEDVFKKED